MALQGCPDTSNGQVISTWKGHCMQPGGLSLPTGRPAAGQRILEGRSEQHVFMSCHILCHSSKVGDEDVLWGKLLMTDV